MTDHFKACPCCGKIHRLSANMSSGDIASCVRCRTPIMHFGSTLSSLQRTAAFSIGAFILFWPAILMPILEVERLGHRSSSSILFGIVELFRHGSYFVGAVVLIFSIIFPLVKILLLLELSLLGILEKSHKAWTYRVMEQIGRWSMMDVLLLAFMVMLVKLGDLVEFSLGPAVFAFVLCVALSIIASLSFDPHSIWEPDLE